MATFEIWKRGDMYEVIFREGEGVSILSYVKTLEEAKKRLKYHKKRRMNGYLLRADSSIDNINSNANEKLKRVL